MVKERAQDIANSFDKALENHDIDGLEKLLVEFDSLSREVAQRDVEDSVKRRELELCIQLHDKMEKALEGIKLEIQKQLAKARQNGKKINKYLNV